MMTTLVRKSTKIGGEDGVGVKNRQAEFPRRDLYSILILKGCFKEKEIKQIKIPPKKS